MVGFSCGMRASPSDHVAAPSKTTSFTRNWLGIVESAVCIVPVNYKANPANHER